MRSALSGRTRVVLTVLILLHLTAIVAAPWSMPPPASYLSQVVAGWFLPYLQATNMYQGYRFFGPDPGPSHLVRYRLEMPDGSQREGMFPNRREQRPRLLYHRYFMLSEHLVDSVRPDGPPQASPPTPSDLRPQGKALVKSYADELLHRYGAQRVTLELVVHDIPTPEDVLLGKRIDDSAGYRTMLELGSFSEPSVSAAP